MTQWESLDRRLFDSEQHPNDNRIDPAASERGAHPPDGNGQP